MMLFASVISLCMLSCSRDDDVGGGSSNYSCQDSNHPHMIDLGLPSGTLWACCNVGANSPEKYGDFYAWGETKAKNWYDWNNYEFGDLNNLRDIGSDISATSYDVAHVKWGGAWQMPTYDHCIELINYTTTHSITQNGVKGILVTGLNGNTIFFPFSGEYNGEYEGELSDYWSSTLRTQFNTKDQAWYLWAVNDNINILNACSRCSGNSIRPIIPGYGNSGGGGSSGGGTTTKNKCKYCLGQKDCRNYFATSYDKYYCHGSGKCTTCNGSGQVSGMFGLGNVACSGCNSQVNSSYGDGLCSKCGGSGVCSHCKGTGYE